jgi:hypothetical protein
LDDRGVIEEESYIPKGDSVALVGVLKRKKKYIKQKKGLEIETVMVEEYENLSLKSDVHHYGKVDKVYMEKKTAKTPYRMCKVRFRKVRKPEFGDKHSSRHGQKGVIGMIVREENMPFTKEGIRPDIIVNPHAFPSRMTIGHLVECVFAKLCCLEGTLGDGSVFVPFRQEVLCDRLEDHGFERYGNEVLYNGFTGETIPTEIFMGPTFYLRLKHMVADKVHARGAGFVNPHDQLTRQPTGGRSKMGGLRFGEMERDSLLSHGLSQFIKESYMERSDKYRWLACKHCGGLMDYSQKEGSYKNILCRLCGTTEFNCFETPFAFKLMKQEMEGMGLAMRLSDVPFEVEEADWVEEDVELEEVAAKREWTQRQEAMEGGTLPVEFPKDVIVDFGGSLGGGVNGHLNEEPVAPAPITKQDDEDFEEDEYIKDDEKAEEEADEESENPEEANKEGESEEEALEEAMKNDPKGEKVKNPGSLDEIYPGEDIRDKYAGGKEKDNTYDAEAGKPDKEKPAPATQGLTKVITIT